MASSVNAPLSAVSTMHAASTARSGRGTPPLSAMGNTLPPTRLASTRPRTLRLLLAQRPRFVWTQIAPAAILLIIVRVLGSQSRSRA